MIERAPGASGAYKNAEDAHLSMQERALYSDWAARVLGALKGPP